MSRLAFLLTALLFAFQAHAAPASAESIELTLNLMHARTNLESVSAGAEGNIRQAVTSAIHGQTLTPDEQAKMDRVIQRAVALVREEISWEELKPMYVKLYAETFSQEEIDGLNAFYASPAGQAYVARIPALTQSMMKVLMAKMADMQPRLDKIMREATQDAPASKAASN